MSIDPFTSATDLAAAIRAGDVSPVDAVDQYLDRIESRGDRTDAFVTVIAEDARERAREAEAALDDGEAWGPLHGVPVAIKDLSFRKEGVAYTMGLGALADNVADRTTVAVRRLEDAGAIVLGTTNTPELGHDVRTTNETFGPTATPFDPDYNAGGSSGGSAAALADGLCALATGSDVGGSLRNPAACCGVASVKPTFGLVPKDSRPNAFRSHTPFGVLGPMARTVEDLGLALDVLAGRDDADPFSTPKPDDYADPEPADAPEIGVSMDMGYFAVAESVRETVADALDAVEDAGASVQKVEIDGPPRPEATYSYARSAPVYFATEVREIQAEHGIDLVDDHGDDLPEDLVSLVMSGQGYDAPEYNAADFPRTELYDAVEEALTGRDALAVPSLATTPLTHDEPLPTEIDGESVAGLPTDWTLAWPFNMTGHPVVNVPAGTVDGLPVGLQLVGERFAERRLLEVAAAFEDANPWSYPDGD